MLSKNPSIDAGMSAGNAEFASTSISRNNHQNQLSHKQEVQDSKISDPGNQNLHQPATTTSKSPGTQNSSPLTDSSSLGKQVSRISSSMSGVASAMQGLTSSFSNKTEKGANISNQSSSGVSSGAGAAQSRAQNEAASAPITGQKAIQPGQPTARTTSTTQTTFIPKLNMFTNTDPVKVTKLADIPLKVHKKVETTAPFKPRMYHNFTQTPPDRNKNNKYQQPLRHNFTQTFKFSTQQSIGTQLSLPQDYLNYFYIAPL